MNLIFDFDGTICDSLDIALSIGNKYLKENKMALSTKEEVRNIGIKKMMLSRKVSIITVLSYYFKGRKELTRHIPELETFPHLPGVLKELSKRYQMGILTSNLESNARLFLRNNQMSDFFKFIHSESSIFGKEKAIKSLLKRFHLAADDTYYIGDEVRDIEGANKAGVHSVAVTWGYESKKLLQTAKPEIIITQPIELLTL